MTKRGKQVGVRVDEDDLAALDVLTVKLGLTRTEAVRYALRHVAREISEGRGGHTRAADAIAAVKGIVS